MNRNNVLIGAAVVAVLIGGIYLANRLRTRTLPDGGMSQATPSSDLSAVPSPIPGKPQVKISSTKGETIVELDPNTNMESVASFLGKWNRGECNNTTVAQCGLTITDGNVQDASGTTIGKVISGPALASEDQITTTMVLSK